jgi:asparagine synthase (glutamine-hydrolysing)
LDLPEVDGSRWRRELDGALDAALRPWKETDASHCVLFSGGVDSSLLAWELRSSPHLLLFTLGREGSPDLRAGETGAERLGLPWRQATINASDVAAASVRFAADLSDHPWVGRTVLLALALAIERAPSNRLLCGQGVDELFLGYAHYQGLDRSATELREQDDLDRLLQHDWPATTRIAERMGKQVVAPFLSPAFIEAARRVPLELRLPGATPKRFFREWAVERGLPPELAGRPKRAMQYGSGVAALVRAADRPGA